MRSSWPRSEPADRAHHLWRVPNSHHPQRATASTTRSWSVPDRTGWPRRSRLRGHGQRVLVIEGCRHHRRRHSLRGTHTPRLHPRRLLRRSPDGGRFAVLPDAPARGARAGVGSPRAPARAPTRRRHRGGARTLGGRHGGCARPRRPRLPPADGAARRTRSKGCSPTCSGRSAFRADPLAALRFGLSAIRSGKGLADAWFRADPARALVAGLAAHAVLPLEQSPGAAITLMLGIAGHAVGWPFPRGGSQRIADALASYFRSLGGEIDHRPARESRSMNSRPPGQCCST